MILCPSGRWRRLRILDFWGSVKYLHHRSYWATPGQSEPLCRDFPTSPGLPTPTEKRRLRRRRAAKDRSQVVPSRVVLEDPTLVVPSLVVLEDPTPVVCKVWWVLEDLTLVVSEIATELPNFTAAAVIKKAVFAFNLWAVLRAWAVLESTPVREHSESTPKSAPIQESSESTPEPAPVREHLEFTPESAPVWEQSESTLESAPVLEPSESTQEPAPVQESSESTPESAPVQ